MRILVAVDGSAHSLKMLEGLMDHVSRFREPPELTLIHVHRPVPQMAERAWGSAAALARYYEDESVEALRAEAKFLADRKVEYRTVTKVGEIAHEIADYAAAEGFDLVALGTHGHSNLQNLVLGSVATKLLALTRLPVLLFR